MYVFKEHIYTSNNSTVYRAIRKLDSKQYIIKHIPIRKTQTAKREIENLKLCIGKQHIVQLIDYHINDKGTYIILEDCKEGNLQKLAGKLSINEIKKYVKDILYGLLELKSLNICFCDLKLSNVVIQNSICKLCDLGSSQIIKKDKLTKLIGTPIYMSPEHIKSEYSYPADMWSLGILIYYLIYNKYPWSIEVLDQKTIFSVILNQKPDLTNLDSEVYDFVSKCLDINPYKRLTIEEALEHSFILSLTNQ